MMKKIHKLFHPNGFFAALWPYRYSAFFFCHCNLKSKIFRAIYTIFAMAASFLHSYFGAYKSYKYLNRNEASDVLILIAFFDFLFQVILVPVHILTWFFKGHLCYNEIIASFITLDKKLANICSKNVNFKKTVIRQLICLFLPVLLNLLILLGYHFCMPMPPTLWNIFDMVITGYLKTIPIILMAFFGNLIYFIGERYALINSTLKDMIGFDVKIDSTNNQNPQSLPYNFDKAFEIQVFACIFSTSCIIVYDLYVEYKIGLTVFCPWMNRILNSILGILFHLGVITYVAYCCHRTAREANGTMKILSSSTTDGEDLRLEVSSFSYQLMHYHLDFSPLGFFQLDLELVQSMVGSIGTYLVILVQTEPTMPLKDVKNETASKII